MNQHGANYRKKWEMPSSLKGFEMASIYILLIPLAMCIGLLIDGSFDSDSLILFSIIGGVAFLLKEFKTLNMHFFKKDLVMAIVSLVVTTAIIVLCIIVAFWEEEFFLPSVVFFPMLYSLVYEIFKLVKMCSAQKKNGVTFIQSPTL